MATTTLLFGAVFLLCAAAVVLLGRQVLAARRPAGGAAPAQPSPWVARVVEDRAGTPLGEVVRVQGEDVVVKRGGSFLVLPRGALAEAGDKLRAGDFDRPAAEARGEAWRAAQEDAMAYDAEGLPVPRGG